MQNIFIYRNLFDAGVVAVSNDNDDKVWKSGRVEIWERKRLKRWNLLAGHLFTTRYLGKVAGHVQIAGRRSMSQVLNAKHAQTQRQATATHIYTLCRYNYFHFPNGLYDKMRVRYTVYSFRMNCGHLINMLSVTLPHRWLLLLWLIEVFRRFLLLSFVIHTIHVKMYITTFASAWIAMSQVLQGMVIHLWTFNFQSVLRSHLKSKQQRCISFCYSLSMSPWRLRRNISAMRGDHSVDIIQGPVFRCLTRG